MNILRPHSIKYRLKTLFLIPARGGSKGVPGKNIRPLGGIPLIEYSIRDALAVAESAEDVVVSTDSSEIADISRKAGASVPFMRPEELATDTAASRDVMIHALDFLKYSGTKYDSLVLLQPTSPFRNPEDIRKGLRLFEEQRPDMVVSVKQASTNPYYNAYECDADGLLRISKGDGMITRRQDAPPVWEFDGSIYIIDPSSLRKFPSLGRMERILPLPNSVNHNVDIDTELDFIIADHLLNLKSKL